MNGKARVHLIAIGGAIMHNLALSLKEQGFQVTGSDDEIFDPAKSRLDRAGLLPEAPGWFPEKLDPSIDFVVLGMHARADNPELARARDLNLPIYSFPEYMYQHSKNKTRVVIGGSHGKTTITSMVMHVLRQCGKDFDYLVGAQLEGFDTMVRVSENATIAVFEGDEYLASPIDRRPKFHLYHPQVALLSGIAWDHINVFPTFENYVDQFVQFAALIQDGGLLAYYEGDPHLRDLARAQEGRLRCRPYTTPEYRVVDGVTEIATQKGWLPLKVFGDHNLQNMMGAKLVCNELGITDDHFFRSMAEFRGAARRLQLLGEKNGAHVFLDFAHAPSKLKATVKAVGGQFPNRKLVAAMELHTFSSLSEHFLRQYEGSMEEADLALVYFNPHTLAHKKLPALDPMLVRQSFGAGNIEVFTDSTLLRARLLGLDWTNHNLLLMSSGNFDGISFQDFAADILEKA